MRGTRATPAGGVNFSCPAKKHRIAVSLQYPGMRIVILGAGQVGSSVAENLVSEANDLTVVDIDASRLKRLQDRFDLRTVTGNAAHPAVLEQAGAREADMLLAVTQSDEINMVACKLAATMFNIPTKIARIRSADTVPPEIFSPRISRSTTRSVPSRSSAITSPSCRISESLQVLEFADGKVSRRRARISRWPPGGPGAAEPETAPAPGRDAGCGDLPQRRPVIPEGRPS
jgi:trk system potassium uptake protein TrkA